MTITHYAAMYTAFTWVLFGNEDELTSIVFLVLMMALEVTSIVMHEKSLQRITELEHELEKEKSADMYDFEITDDNVTITYICAKSRSEAIEIYCREKGCPEEYVKKHCVIRHTKLPRAAKW